MLLRASFSKQARCPPAPSCACQLTAACGLQIHGTYSYFLPAGSKYAYVEDLWQLDRSPDPAIGGHLCLTGLWPTPSVTPLQASVRQVALQDCPDPRFCQFLVRGLREGFRIGYNAPHEQLRSAKRNIPSAYEHPEVVDK